MEKNSNLTERYIAPPYSVLDSRKGYWQERKRYWSDLLGPDSETREGALYESLAMRMPDLYLSSKAEREAINVSFEEYVAKHTPVEVIEAEQKKVAYAGVSIFDPVLAEIIYHWFAPGKGSKILDCFAGGLTRGFVACKSGHNYTGIEVRPEQVEHNLRRVQQFGIGARYIAGDARAISQHIGYASQDLIFTCPPYYGLETYSDQDNDASNQKTYEAFIELLSEAFSASIKCLKWNRFAVVVVSDVRSKSGYYYSFPEDVIKIFRNNGCHLWNDIVLLNNDGSAKLRAGGYMNRRKVVRVHQRVLVFYKGRPRAIPKVFPSLNKVLS